MDDNIDDEAVVVHICCRE